jgi:hypothetical protein
MLSVGQGAYEYDFKLTRGSSAPVCKAYLQRLNEATYDSPPYCGLPQSGGGAGFEAMDRVPLSKDQEVHLSGDVYRFWQRPNPLVAQKDWDNLPIFADTDMRGWRYTSPLDLANDGGKENITLWQGYGLREGQALCGDHVSTSPAVNWGFRPRQLPLIMDADQHIDGQKTAQFFARARPATQPQWTLPPFAPIGYFIDVFKYRGLTYIATFFDSSGDYNGARRGAAANANILGILLNRRGHIGEVCEFRMSGHDYPPSTEKGK